MTTYVNGEKQNDSNKNEEPIDNQPWCLGDANSSSMLISEFRIWSTERSATDIKQNINKELISSTELEAYCWRINEGTGNQVNRLGNDSEVTKGYLKNEAIWFEHKTSFPSDDNSNSTKFDIVRLTSNTVATLSHKLLTGGIQSLLELDTQETPAFSTFVEKSSEEQQDDRIVYDSDYVRNVPSDKLDFNGAAGIYYWDIFFHAPFMLAERLNTAQHFDQAQTWYHYIFNPTFKSNRWRFLPSEKEAEDGINNYKVLSENLFNAHSQAKNRFVAYRKAIAMRYIDNLIDRGDALFRRYTYETIVEATLYYVMAYDLLGKRPQISTKTDDRTVDISVQNASADNSQLLQVEETEASKTSPKPTCDLCNPAIGHSDFYLPENNYFQNYWSRVEDRLYKIRNSLNIEGVYQGLPLFQPAINPEMLLKRASAGLRSEASLSPVPSAILPYRFTTVLAKAQSLAAQVTQFGSALLSALEKKDAEELAVLRNTQEATLLKMTRSVKENQIEAAKETVLSLAEALNQAETRERHYTQLINEGLSPFEISQIVTMNIAHGLSTVSGVLKYAAAGAYIIPDNSIMIGVTPNDVVTFGGTQIGRAIDAKASEYALLAEQFSFAASMSSLLGGFHRRTQDWDLQQTLATHDIEQIRHQKESAEWQLKIALRDLEIHEQNIKHNHEIDTFLGDKFTNRELYQWMVSKLTGLYFQTFQMAHDLALSAQKAFQFELTSKATFVDRSAYWDSLKKGLLAGEILQVDLNHMEKAYLERNVRRFEIEKTISLLALDPKALLDLKRNGSCEFSLTELLFSLDFPGHYSRQIKNISISFPAVVGPYQNIHATLSQRVHRTLIEADIKGLKYLLNPQDKDADSKSIRQNWRQNQQVALSRGLNDSGLFQLNFQDERYLPFEGTGLVSDWHLEVNKDSLNLSSLTDVVLKFEYTALPGDETFKKAVTNALPKDQIHSRIFSFAQDFGEAWHRFLRDETPNKELSWQMEQGYFQHLGSKLIGIYLQLELTPHGKDKVEDKKVCLKIGEKNLFKGKEVKFSKEGILFRDNLNDIAEFIGTEWTLIDDNNDNFFTNTNVTNMFLLLTYRG